MTFREFVAAYNRLVKPEYRIHLYKSGYENKRYIAVWRREVCQARADGTGIEIPARVSIDHRVYTLYS